MIQRIKNYFFTLKYIAHQNSEDLCNLREQIEYIRDDMSEIKTRLFQMELDCDIARVYMSNDESEEVE